jgi:hypothetical protein
MLVIEYDVGPGAYGVAQAGDGAVWTSLPERGALARVSPDGQVSRVPLDAGPSRPMVLALGPDGAIWFSRGDGRIGRIAPSGDLSSVPVTTADGSLRAVRRPPSPPSTPARRMPGCPWPGQCRDQMPDAATALLTGRPGGNGEGPGIRQSRSCGPKQQ